MKTMKNGREHEMVKIDPQGNVHILTKGTRINGMLHPLPVIKFDDENYPTKESLTEVAEFLRVVDHGYPNWQTFERFLTGTIVPAIEFFNENNYGCPRKSEFRTGSDRYIFKIKTFGQYELDQIMEVIMRNANVRMLYWKSWNSDGEYVFDLKRFSRCKCGELQH